MLEMWFKSKRKQETSQLLEVTVDMVTTLKSIFLDFNASEFKTFFI